MTQDTVTHDVLLARTDGSIRKFRIYGRPMPESGDIITLPVDGQLIRACATRPTLERAETTESVDAEAVELVE